MTPLGKKYPRGEEGMPFHPDYFDALADAIQILHNKDIVHRDIRPDNIIFEELPAGSNPRYRAVLIDLGFCCEIKPQPYCGTLRYASDQVLRAYDKDPKVVTVSKEDDIISLVYCAFAFEYRGFKDNLRQLQPNDGIEAFIIDRKRLFESYSRFFQQLQHLTLQEVKSLWRAR